MQTLILLHGALGAASQFEALKAALKTSFEVQVLEFYGHGASLSDEPFRIEGFAEQLKAYLDARDLRQVWVFGYSMGGYVALHLAAQHPEYFEKIITLGTKFHWTPESAAKEVQYLNPEKVEAKVPAYAAYLATLHGSPGWKTVMQKTAAMMLELGNGAALKDSDFKRIAVPCVLGLGDADTMVSAEETEQVEKVVPNAQVLRLEQTPHPIDKVELARLVKFIGIAG